MANKERELLEAIERKPTISNDELARELGLAKTSVAVYMSRLLKEGRIRKLGYEVVDRRRATVIGAVNKDVGGVALAPLRHQDSNPGKVRVSVGGVGMNIASNLSLMGGKPRFITAYGEDEFTDTFVNHCRKMDIDISCSKAVSGINNATYIYIGDEFGDMEIAMSDMEIVKDINVELVSAMMDVINDSEVVALDANLTRDVIQYILENCKKPVFIDPVSTTKAEKLDGLLKHVHTIKPNVLEAEVLCGIKIREDKDVYRAAEILMNKGVKQVFIGMGATGIVCCNEKEGLKEVKPVEVKVVNATGGGDAFMAGVMSGYMLGLNLEETAKLGAGAAAIAIETESTVNEALTLENAMAKAGLQIRS